MRIIEFYILRRVFILFAAVLIIAIGLVLTVQLLKQVNFITTNSQTFFTLLKLCTLFIPSAVSLVLPFAILLAASIVLSMMNQDSELVVINASGAPHYTVWRPVILLALIACVLSFYITNFSAPYASLVMREMKATANADLIGTVITENTINRVQDNLYIKIGERHPDGSFSDIFLADERNPEVQIETSAIRGSIIQGTNGSFLIMQDGELKRKDLKSGDTSIIKFDTNTFNLDDLTSDTNDERIYPKDQPLLYLFNPDPDDSYYQRRPQQYTAEIHRRLTDWIYPLVYAMIALACAGDVRSHREARISATFSAITLSLAIYWISYFLKNRADNDLAYIPLLYIIPVFIICFITFLFFTNRQLTLPSWFTILIDSSVQAIKKLLRMKQKEEQ